MKRFLALALVAMMAVTAVATVSAADLFAYDFEKDAVGAFVNVDNSIRVYPKQFAIEVATFNNSKVLKCDHTGYLEEGRNGNKDKDCYVDLFQGGTNTAFKLGDQFVLSYDIYLEKVSDSEPMTGWQVACIRTTPASGTKFNHVAQIRGSRLYKRDKSGDEDLLAKLKTGTWYNIAIAFDNPKKTTSLYLNGDLLVKDDPWYVDDTTSTEPERIRFAWNSALGDGIAYVDNVKVISGLTPANSTGKTYQAETTAAATTKAAAAATTAAAAKTTSAKTADAGIIIAAVAIVAFSGAVIVKKKH